MGRKPRSQKPHINKPSPLQQVHLTRPISTLEIEQPSAEMGLVRDPLFWKRFSTAIHIAEEGGATTEPAGRGSRSNSGSSGGTLGKNYSYGDDWLLQQRKDKRRCRTYCISITIVVMILIAAGAICGWFFTQKFNKS